MHQNTISLPILRRYVNYIITMRASEAVKQCIVFDPVRPCVRPSIYAKPEKLLFRNWCTLVGISLRLTLKVVT